ncbi:uncharacterized protein LOC129598835 [Paramacrobiotus metropolitanus]|uniref:uncharacterized protein LOC129598565 n=1 Tax=Paramacrobiotus metropolitanus TaxID=2943436 RepID=UPI002445CBBC|nr:uncharacterized protein LOC129598565 [Paramacrobiotus metropolitanus]XP_055352893.1 uncharacterized protein LOC129598835 [Paramacrobiotus metropolitanus]
MGLIKSCLLCSLKTGCFFAAFYTFALAILLLVFNVHDYWVVPTYIAWSRIISFIGAVFLFIAAIALIIGLLKNNPGWLSVWIIIFLVYILYQIAFVCWNIYYYTLTEASSSQVPADIRASFLANIIVFGILIFFNILALIAVHSEREHMGGKGLVVMA